MARTEDTSQLETWEATTEGVTVWVWVYDKREDKYKKQRVGGRSGSKTLHIRADDRRFNMEQVVDENKALDPFTNGLLRLVTAAQEDEDLDTTYHLDDEALKALLEVRDEDVFKSEIESIDSELILRRLKDTSEKHGQVWQLEAIRTLLDERYKRGGSQRVVADMIATGEMDGSTRLS